MDVPHVPVEVHGTWRGTEGGAQGVGDDVAGVLRLEDATPARDRREQRPLIDPLMLEAATFVSRLRIGEDDERCAIEKGTGDAVDDRRRAGAEGRQTHRRTLCDLRLRHRRERAAGFGGGEHERQPCASRRVDQIEIAATAWHAEDCAAARCDELLDDDLGRRRHREGMVLRYDHPSA